MTLKATAAATALLLGSLAVGLAGCDTGPQQTAGTQPTTQTPPAQTVPAPTAPEQSTPTQTAANSTGAASSPGGDSASTAPDALGLEAGARLQSEQNTIDVVSRFEPGLVYISTEQQVAAQNPFGMMGEEGASAVRVSAAAFSSTMPGTSSPTTTSWQAMGGGPAASPSG